MKTIAFSPDLKFPLDVATQTLAFIARKRAGKSYAAGVLVEGMAANGVPFVIIDPVGNSAARYEKPVVTGRLSSASLNLSNRPKPMPVVRSTLRRASPSSGTPAPDEGEARFPRGAREMLKALACRNATYGYTDEDSGRASTLTKTQVATLAGISPTSGTFNTYLSSLRTAEYIGETRDGMFITARGLAFLGDDVPHAPTDTKELVSLWASKFSGKTKDVLWYLVNIHPNGLSKDQLGEEVGISSTSGTFNTYLSSLRSNGLVETIDGELRASDNLFL